MDVDPEEIVGLTEDLMNTRPHTDFGAGAYELAYTWLHAEGLNPQRIVVPGGPTLLATIGSGGPHLALIGHVDVVRLADPEQWRTAPFGNGLGEGCWRRDAAQPGSGEGGSCERSLLSRT